MRPFASPMARPIRSISPDRRVNYCDICNPFPTPPRSWAIRRSAPRTSRTRSTSSTRRRRHSAGGLLCQARQPGRRPSGQLEARPVRGDDREHRRQAQGNPELFKDTALFVTFDEGGGYCDSGFIQPLDFFGDGPRIPLLVVSPYSRGGQVSAQLYRPCLVGEVHRAQLGPDAVDGAQPRQSSQSAHGLHDNPYVPLNMPAVGDLFDMFDFD